MRAIGLKVKALSITLKSERDSKVSMLVLVDWITVNLLARGDQRSLTLGV